MRVLKTNNSFLDALVAGITTLTNLVQLQVPDLQGLAKSSWAMDHQGSRNSLLLEHPGGMMVSCPKALASLIPWTHHQRS